MAVNTTVNATLNATNESGNFAHVLVDGTKDEIIPGIADRLGELLSAPVQTPDMLWIVTPLIVMTLLMQFYFGRYNQEELGWNTAVGNSMVLIFVSLDLLRFVYGDTGVNNASLENIHLYNFEATMIALTVATLGFLLMFTNFFHILPKKFSFFLSNSLPINLFAYIAIVLVYTQIALDFYTLLASVTLFVILVIFFNVLHYLLPKAIDLKEVADEKK